MMRCCISGVPRLFGGCSGKNNSSKYLLYLFILLVCPAALGQKYERIITREFSAADRYFDRYMIHDKYRWLEDFSSSETNDWIVKQNNLSRKYLDKAVNSTGSFSEIRHDAYAEYENPQKDGDYFFRIAYTDNVGCPALYYQTKFDGEPKLLVNPREISQEDNIVLKDYKVSGDSKLLAYEYSRNGSDWCEVQIISLKKKIHYDDHLTRLKFANIAWLGNGFFYSTWTQDGKFSMTRGQQVFYHRIGTNQQSDSLIFERKNNSLAVFRYLTTSDERFFVLEESNGKTGKINIYYSDQNSPQKELRPLLTNLSGYHVDIRDSNGDKFIAIISKESENDKIVLIDPAQPYKWSSLGYDYSDAFLLDVKPFKDRMIAVYQADQQPIIVVVDYSGEILFKMLMPQASSVGGFVGNPNDEELYFNFQSYTIPPVVYKFNIRTFNKELTRTTNVSFDYYKIEYKAVEYPSTDSVMIPMVLVYSKGLKLDGNNPVVLNAYGGFNVVKPPVFDPGIVYFIEQGGVFAFANIRGGGDKGRKWAEDGRGLNKQQSFDDFIAAAEYLIAANYTNKSKIASMGASNGGLLVAATAIQRPDLFRVVVPIVAPLDMLRFEQFTVGSKWIAEYGTVRDSTCFKHLLAFSPYHNIRDDVNYPAMLVVTSENDDRVPPFHSFKFVARLQSREIQTNPILLKTELRAGHNGSSGFLSYIEAKADIYGFIMNEFSKKEAPLK